MRNLYDKLINRWALDESIKDELRLLLIISSLIKRFGKCDKSNFFFSQLLNESPTTINDQLKKLKSKGYIKISTKEEREITIIHLKNIK